MDKQAPWKACRLLMVLLFLSLPRSGSSGNGLEDRGPFRALSVSSTQAAVVQANGTLRVWGKRHLEPVQVGKSGEWAAVAAGTYNIVAIKNDGSLWWVAQDGENQAYSPKGKGKTALPLPLGDSIVTPGGRFIRPRWAGIAAGKKYIVALRADGGLYRFNDGFGSIGEQLLSEVGPMPALSMAAGNGYGALVTPDGSLWTWGRNRKGQLGDGTSTPRNSPGQITNRNDWSVVATGGAHVVALRKDGTLWAWGSNEYGQLGDGTTEDRSLPVQVGKACSRTRTTSTTISQCRSEGTMSGSPVPPEILSPRRSGRTAVFGPYRQLE